MPDTNRISVAEAVTGDFIALLSAAHAKGVKVSQLFYNEPERFGSMTVKADDLETLGRIAEVTAVTRESPALVVRVWFNDDLRIVHSGDKVDRYAARTEEERAAEVSRS